MKTRGEYKMRAFIDGERDREAEKLTPAMWQMLHHLADPHNPAHRLREGMSASGGASGTMFALRRRGYVQKHELTPAGRRLLSVEWRYPDDGQSPAK